jgi:hypothetical protein
MSDANGATPDLKNGKRRKIMLVIEDVGDDRFSFTMQGDVERLQDPSLVPSASEYWAAEFFKVCTERLHAERDLVKKLNREERRKG